MTHSQRSRMEDGGQDIVFFLTAFLSKKRNGLSWTFLSCRTLDTTLWIIIIPERFWVSDTEKVNWVNTTASTTGVMNLLSSRIWGTIYTFMTTYAWLLWHSFCFALFCRTEGWAFGIAHARQMFYKWAASPSCLVALSLYVCSHNLRIKQCVSVCPYPLLSC